MDIKVNTKKQIPKSEARHLEGAIDPLAELLGRAQRAYADYIDAQKEVARAYKERELQVEKAYKEEEAQANKAWDKAVEQALAAREKAIQQAEEASKEASKKAMEVYQESIDQASSIRKETSNQAWEVRRETIAQAWRVFTGGELHRIPREPESIESTDFIMTLSAAADPVLAELWDNEGDAAYDHL